MRQFDRILIWNIVLFDALSPMMYSLYNHPANCNSIGGGEMDVALVLSIVFGLIGLFGLIYTIYYGRRGIKKKLLVYEITRSLAIAQAFSPEDDYTLAVVFQKKVRM